MKFTWNNHTYRINWIKPSHLKNVLEIGTTRLDFDTLGIPGQIFFGEKCENSVKIIGKWGEGEIYEKAMEHLHGINSLSTVDDGHSLRLPDEVGRA